jgi:hypothetical protein
MPSALHELLVDLRTAEVCVQTELELPVPHRVLDSIAGGEEQVNKNN